MFQKYSLEIVSHHDQFNNKTMRQYHVDGINTVGVYGDEPFEVRFRNHTSFKVQVKLSLDGTDLLTGEKATTEISKDMWVVQAYGTLNLKAWPESQNGGAALIFTSVNNSVAVHTHGDLSSRGIIAAAVFEEGDIPPPQRFIENHYYKMPTWYTLSYPISWDYNGFGSFGYGSSVGTYGGGSITCNSLGGGATSSTSVNMNATENSNTDVYYNESSVDSAASLQNVAAVGAGQYTEQKISYTTGLIKPVFTESVRVRYLWWNELVAKLKNMSYDAPHGSGFPGDKPTGIKLGNTPRIGSHFGNAFPKCETVQFNRF